MLVGFCVEMERFSGRTVHEMDWKSDWRQFLGRIGGSRFYR